MRGFLEAVSRILRDERANVAIVTALSLPLLVGFTGLGAEAGYWFYKQRTLQASADLAAYAAAVVARAGEDGREIETAAMMEADLHGYDPDAGSIDVNWPPDSGTNVNARSVEVLIEQSVERSFSAFFLKTDPLMSVRAVASYDEPAPACIIALHETGSAALLFSGSATAQFTGCDLMSNSLARDAIVIQGAVEVRASCVNATGGVDNSATLILTDCPSPRLNLPRAEDPYAAVPAPEETKPCAEEPKGKGAYTLSPGTYCGGLSLSGEVTLEAGVYVVTGGSLRINGNSTVTGEGITFYLTDGADLVMNGTASVDLTAPTSGDYSGLLFYADRESTGTTATLNGTADSRLLGALYFPSQHVRFLGNFSGSGGCTRIVALTVEVRGDPDFASNCIGAGFNEAKVPGAVRLVE